MDQRVVDVLDVADGSRGEVWLSIAPLRVGGVRGPRPPSRPLPQPPCLSNGGSPRGVRQRCEVGKDRLVRWLEAEHQTASGLGSSPQSTLLKMPPEPGEFRRYHWAGQLRPERPSKRANERSGGREEQQPHRPSSQTLEAD